MDAATLEILGSINRRFYRSEAARFSATRREPWPGWERALLRRPGPNRILDVGCGNGRLARWLDTRGVRCEYVGVEWSPELLHRARNEATSPHPRSWIQADLSRPGWESNLPPGGFDLIAVFGVLHHLAGRAARGALLATLADRLAPRGTLAVALWQFGRHERFMRRFLSWEDYNRTALEPIDVSQLEEGDHLLPFGSSVPDGEANDTDPTLPRYCHFVDDAEAETLTAPLPLVLRESFLSDGRSGDLNRYLLFERRSE